MGCYHPLNGMMVEGCLRVVAKRKALRSPLLIPCGRCLGCRADRAKSWAVRCVHEADMHKASCFITLTYNDAHLPKDGSLVKRDWQLFMKKLRELVMRPKFRKKFRKVFSCEIPKLKFYMCGEYGENYSRPHYHACLFGVDFPDKRLFSVKDGFNLYRSAFLERLWTKGFSTIGEVSFASALYLAKYVMKQYDGDLAGSVYGPRLREFALMSRRPGIGRTWIEKYAADVYPKDFVILRGRKFKSPKYYQKYLMLTNRDDFDSVKDARFKREVESNAVKDLTEIYREMDARESVHKQYDQMAKRQLDQL